MKNIKKIYIIGALIGVFFGSFLHFIFEIIGSWKPIALIGAVNESTWEHLKIGFWPLFLFAIWEYFYYVKDYKNFFLAKALTLLTVPIVIILLFYGYLLFTPDNFIFDILIFVLAIIIAEYIGYKIIISKYNYSNYNIFSYIVIILLFLAFSLLTFYPPQNILFHDPVSGGYGIINKK